MIVSRFGLGNRVAKCPSAIVGAALLRSSGREKFDVVRYGWGKVRPTAKRSVKVTKGQWTELL